MAAAARTIRTMKEVKKARMTVPTQKKEAHAAAVSTSVAFVPPKPKEFDSTVAILIFLARLGTRSISVSTEGLSRLIVGGATESRMARVEKIASTAPAAPKR